MFKCWSNRMGLIRQPPFFVPGVHNTAKSEAGNTCNCCRVSWPGNKSQMCRKKPGVSFFVLFFLFFFFKAGVKGLYYDMSSLFDCAQCTLTRQRMWCSRTAWQGWKESVCFHSQTLVRRGLFAYSASLPLGLITHKETNVWVKDLCNEG